MDYLTSLLGHVASYGIRADHAARDMIDRTVDEFSLTLSQRTGMSFQYLTTFKSTVAERVLGGKMHVPGLCKGRTKLGAPCKKRALMGYCDRHRDQEDLVECKKRRVAAHVARSGPRHHPYGAHHQPIIRIAPTRFIFT